MIAVAPESTDLYRRALDDLGLLADTAAELAAVQQTPETLAASQALAAAFDMVARLRPAEPVCTCGIPDNPYSSAHEAGCPYGDSLFLVANARTRTAETDLYE